MTLTAVVDESHVLRIELPPNMAGEMEVTVREKFPLESSAALWQTADNAPKVDDSRVLATRQRGTVPVARRGLTAYVDSSLVWTADWRMAKASLPGLTIRLVA